MKKIEESILSSEESILSSTETITTTCTKILGIAGLIKGGDSTDSDLIISKTTALGISSILRDCAIDIDDAAGEIQANLCKRDVKAVEAILDEVGKA